jgi:hypothetical protein
VGWQGGIRQGSTLIFNALLPLAGTWVGTVIAYYFSSKNFETANQSMQRVVCEALTQRSYGKQKSALLPWDSGSAKPGADIFAFTAAQETHLLDVLRRHKGDHADQLALADLGQQS